MHERQRVAELYSRLAPKLAAFVSASLRCSPEMAEDGVHAVFLRLLDDHATFKKASRLADREAFAYLYKAVRNRVLDDLNLTANKTVALEQVIGLGLQHDPTVEGLTALVRLAVVVEKLKEPYQTVLRLLLIEEKPAAEISVELKRPLNTVYQQIHRGLIELKRELRKRSPSNARASRQ